MTNDRYSNFCFVTNQPCLIDSVYCHTFYKDNTVQTINLWNNLIVTS